MEDDLLLRIVDLHTYFYTDKGVIKAVNGIDLNIRRGQTLGFVGESGCGKSVTALSIMRLIPHPKGKIAKGQVILDGQNLLELNKSEMRHIRGNRISMVYQEPMTSLNPVFTVGNQISEAIRLHQGVSRRDAMDLTVEMLKKVGIPSPKRCARQYPHHLSGGMRQRAMIAMALSCNPQLLIADEPTTALDVTIQAQILDLMNQLRQDMQASILLISHDLGVIAEMAQSVAIMYAGQIVEYSDLVNFISQPKHPYSIGLIESMPKMDEPVPQNRILKAIPGVVPSLLDLPQGCSFQDRCAYKFDKCSQSSPPLLEVGNGHLVRCWNHGPKS